ncbi:MAG: hypothetical protein Q8P18_30375 [Pseudomonadota bacterium]|nr:hypothetical protein [Pseudomonadota bacterium]
MNDDQLVRDIWKQLPHRAVVGHRLVRAVGARGWERFRFGRFLRFFQRSGIPDPWDPAAVDVGVGLGEVGIAGARKAVAHHAAPPGAAAAAAAKAPVAPNVPKALAAAGGKPPVEGKPAPRIGEIRKDDTETLRKKSMEAEKKKVDPARANLFKVKQPVAKLPMRPVASADGDTPAAPRPPPTRPTAPSASEGGRPPMRPPTAVPVRPTSASPIRPFRMPVEGARRAVLPDGPEEVDDLGDVVPAARPPVDRGFDFGLGGSWDDEPEARAPASSGPVPESLPVAPPPPPARAPVTAAGAAPPVVPARTVSAPSAPPPARTVPAPSAPPRPPPRPPIATPPSSAGPPKPASPPRPAKPGGGGLDDLFGMGASGGGESTRVRMPKREDADANKPRRAMVTPDAELGKGGVDRRPPPPKPPSVTPTGGAGAADPEGDGGD